MIRIYVFINGSVGQATNTAAQDVWFNASHPNLENIFVVDAANPDNASFIRQFQVNSFPTIVFVRLQAGTQGRTVRRIQGVASGAQIQKVLSQALNADWSTDQNGNGQPAIIKGDQGENGFGFGFGLFNLDPLALLILAGLGFYFMQNKKR